MKFTLIFIVVLLFGGIIYYAASSRQKIERQLPVAQIDNTVYEAASTTTFTATATINNINSNTTTTMKTKKEMTPSSVASKTALLANGCFWCVQHDIEEVPGVIAVVSGYADGTADSPTYENYAEEGYREVVLVTYDPAKVSYANLVEHIIKHGDPTDATGSFHDRGPQYAPAIYYENDEEKLEARKVINAIDALKVFSAPLPLAVIPRVKFWPAEEYHQDYGNKNPIRYSYYRGGSGRNAFIQKYWGNNAEKFTVTTLPQPMTTASTQAMGVEKTHPWESFVKPSESALRAMLTPLQYKVTQENGTEPSFNNLYDNNYDKGVYVDIVSGEPLYLSKDKFDSGTGWPSFVKPISDAAVVLKEDKGFFSTRTEVRSRYADSHLGHVFDDGPTDRGGKRYCMNSAALRFVPKADMEKEGYGYLLASMGV